MAEALKAAALPPHSEIPLTIAIVTWNSERWIERCLRSIGAACAGVAHEVVVYEGLPHSFFDRKAEEFAEQAADAWRRVLAFVASNA
jgi:dienelactone hydrolase